MPERSVIPDPFKFAVEGQSVAGEVPLADFARLADMLVDRQGKVSYSVAGELGSERQARLRVRASGMLPMQCQRCLARMEWPLEVETVLELVRKGQSIPDEELENDEFDTIEAPTDMDVLALVEDEVVLAMPIAPRHEHCEVPLPSEGVAKKESPFASLDQLRKNDAK